MLLGTGLALYFVATNPVRLMGWLPAALTLYFFIPFVTLLTLWQTVPLLLTARAALLARLRVAPAAQPLFLFILFVFIGSSSYAILLGADPVRALIRILYYLGMLALMSFAYEMGRRDDCQKILLRGLVVLGAVLAVYGLYQIVATFTGLPVRGILRNTSSADLAFEGGILRINSLANEPKRLGYVMFLCTLACPFLAQANPRKKLRFIWTGVGILFMSLFTVAGSYFLAIALFGALALLLYPSRTTRYAFGLLGLVLAVYLIFPDLGLFEVITSGYERRLVEVEVGLDGQRVYRQEFFAWDYLAKNPLPSFFGVGLGQYYITLYHEYGVGVGFNELGGLNPLNSTFLELLFDLSGIVAAMFYGAILLLIWKLRRAGETFLCLALLFVTVQSLTIITLHWMVLFAGLGLARVTVWQRHRVDKYHGVD